MEKQDHTQETHRIWLSEEERIASFHEVNAYTLRVIQGHDAYMSFLQSLLEQGFRFQ